MKTALYDRHLSLGAKMVEFCGWEMPLYYKGIVHEHNTVRQSIGLFDISHMGRIRIYGPEAELFLDYISTNHLTRKPDLTATYTAWANQNGGTIDDVIVYKEDSQHFFVVVNCCNREKDFAYLKSEGKNFDVLIQDQYRDGILAVQGPKTMSLFSRFFSLTKTLKHMHFVKLDYKGHSLIISSTGYTGAGGFEIFAPEKIIIDLWDFLLTEGVEPIGLGARDTLRLEMGFALYGHEMNESIAPTESVLAWTVKLDKSHFVGKEALLSLENNFQKRNEYGIMLLDRGIAREGYEVFKSEKMIGFVTSGTLSPTLNKSIAIILVKQTLEFGEVVEVQIRKTRCKAKIVKMPFLEE